jgi:hypothetical protein
MPSVPIQTSYRTWALIGAVVLGLMTWGWVQYARGKFRYPDHASVDYRLAPDSSLDPHKALDDTCRVLVGRLKGLGCTKVGAAIAGPDRIRCEFVLPSTLALPAGETRTDLDPEWRALLEEPRGLPSALEFVSATRLPGVTARGRINAGIYAVMTGLSALALIIVYFLGNRTRRISTSKPRMDAKGWSDRAGE